MSAPSASQKRMDEVFNNYFNLSNTLQSDINALLDGINDSHNWRRNFIRTSASLIEGYTHCLREMCAISFNLIAPKLTKKESKLLLSERSFDTNERLKHTLRAAYKLFELEPVPIFNNNEWSKARQFLDKRDLLMHPKTSIDLEISDDIWSEVHDGALWIIEQLFKFFSLFQQKHNI